MYTPITPVLIYNTCEMCCIHFYRGIGKLSYTLPDNGSMYLVVCVYIYLFYFFKRDLGVDPNVVSPTIDPADFCRAKNKKAFFIAHSTVLQCIYENYD